MKCSFLFIFPVLLLLSVEAKSQAYNYHPFPDSNIVWHGYKLCGQLGPASYVPWSLRVTGDTTINGLDYKMIGTLGCIREDSNKRVYCFKFWENLSYERLLYDFSLTQGDTFSGLIAFKVDTPVYYGIPRRTLHFGDSVYASLGIDQDIWVEGIGSWWNPWFVRGGGCHFSVVCQALLEDMSIIFQRNDSYANNCPTYTSIAEILPIWNANISPNPTTTFFTLQLSSPPSTQTYFQLYDAIGRQVKREEVVSETTTIHRNNLPCGIYFWQLQSENKIVGRGKLVME